MQRFRGKRERFRGAFGPLSARFRGAFGVPFLAAPHYEKSPLFSCFLRFRPKTHRSGKNRKTLSYIGLPSYTYPNRRYCVTAQ